jgi:excisionase family DNA binding protein
MDTRHANNITRRLSRREAAQYLGLSPNTLARWAVDGTPGLPYYRIGGRAIYDLEDLDAFRARRRIGPPVEVAQ